MKSKILSVFVSSAIATCVLSSAAAAYCSTKWSRLAGVGCEHNDSYSHYNCPWVTTADFDADEVNKVIIDTYNWESGTAFVTAKLCYQVHDSGGSVCSSGFSSNTQSGSTPISIDDSVSGGTGALNLWRNHPASYPYVMVIINNPSGSLKGVKVIN